MAWGGSGESGLAEIVYEPLPAMGRDELRRLRATIGEADSEGDAAPPSRRHRSASSVSGVVVDLRDDAPRTVPLVDVLAGMHSEISDLRSQVHDLQTSLDRLVIALLG